MRQTIVSQKIIPILPEHIPLHTYSPNETTKAVSRISQAAAEYEKAYLGLAVKRSRKGIIDSLALATSREVVVITLKCSPASNDRLLINLLAGPTSDQKLTLVAFGMARIAIQLSANSPAAVAGIDMPACPSKIISRVSSEVEKSKVDALWDTEGSSEELCLRAWITAWCASFLLLDEDGINSRGNS